MDSVSGKTYVYAGGKMAVVSEFTKNASGGWDQAFEYFATDHLGTVQFSYKVDASSNFIASSTHDYEPFGLEIGPIETSDNTHRFTGHERDAETGNDYMHYRFYGNSIGRFMKPDNVTGTMQNPQDWNLYAYVHGNPITFNDPTGHNGSDPDNPLNKQKEHDKKQGVVRTDPAGDEEESNVRKVTEIEVLKRTKNSLKVKVSIHTVSTDKQGHKVTKTESKVISFNRTSDGKIHKFVGKTEISISIKGANQGKHAQGSGRFSSFLKSAGKVIGGAFEMAAGGETMELGGALLEATVVIGAGGAVTSETGIGAVAAGIAGGITGLVGLSMVGGGIFMMCDGAKRITEGLS